jgi:hypothetical protein
MACMLGRGWLATLPRATPAHAFMRKDMRVHVCVWGSIVFLKARQLVGFWVSERSRAKSRYIYEERCVLVCSCIYICAHVYV